MKSVFEQFEDTIGARTVSTLQAENAKLRAALDAIRRHSDPDSEAHDLALRALEE